MEWENAITEWEITLRAAGRSQATIGLRRYQIRRLALDLTPLLPWDVTGSDLVTWFGCHDWSRATLRSCGDAVRGFYGWGLTAGYVHASPADALPHVKQPGPEPRPAPREAYRGALAAADQRERLMLRLAAELGMRRGEVARASTGDLERDETGWTLRVVGKGRKVRRIPLPAALGAEIAAMPAGPLFPGLVDGHLSDIWVGKLVSRLLPEGVSMHALRHAFATAAYAIDRDLLTVQKLLGHSSPVTTRGYVRLPDDALRRTVQAVSAAT